MLKRSGIGRLRAERDLLISRASSVGGPPKAAFPTWHCVYFVQVGDRIKIGWSTWPEQRAKALKGQLIAHVPSTDRCRVRCEHERAMHERWAHLLLEGEWVRAAADLLAFCGGLPR